jgi:hypothetical protein
VWRARGTQRAESSPTRTGPTESGAAKPQQGRTAMVPMLSAPFGGQPPPSGKTASDGNAGVAVQSTRVLARVNGRAITGKDLLSFGPGHEGEQTMTPEMFAFLRERAVVRALTFDEAKRRGITLGSNEQEQIAAVRKSAAERSPDDPDAVDLEARDAEAHLLLDAVLAQRGGPPPYARQSDIDQYYKDHADELEPVPPDPEAAAAARARIDLQIRQILSGEMQTRHQEALANMVKELRAGATISD